MCVREPTLLIKDAAKCIPELLLLIASFFDRSTSCLIVLEPDYGRFSIVCQGLLVFYHMDMTTKTTFQ